MNARKLVELERKSQMGLFPSCAHCALWKWSRAVSCQEAVCQTANILLQAQEEVGPACGPSQLSA